MIDLAHLPPVNESRRRLLLGAGTAMALAGATSLGGEPAATSASAGAGTTNPAGEGTITTRDGTRIYYKDWGSGQPIVFHHGWPLSADDWDAQMIFFLSKGFRVIAHDRRGHGRSSQSATGNDMDPYAAASAALVAHLDLKGAIHVGHST